MNARPVLTPATVQRLRESGLDPDLMTDEQLRALETLDNPDKAHWFVRALSWIGGLLELGAVVALFSRDWIGALIVGGLGFGLIYIGFRIQHGIATRAVMQNRPQEDVDREQALHLWQSQFKAHKGALVLALLKQAQGRGLGVSPHNLALVSCLMTAEPGAPGVREGASAAEFTAAQVTADQALSDPELAALAAETSYALGLLFQLQAYNPYQPMQPDRERLRQSLVCLDNAIKYGPRPAFYHATASQTAGMMHDFQLAYEHARAAVEADPSNGEAWRMAGLAAATVDKYDEAEQCLLKAREVFPQIAGVDEGLAALRQLRGSVS